MAAKKTTKKPAIKKAVKKVPAKVVKKPVAKKAPAKKTPAKKVVKKVAKAPVKKATTKKAAVRKAPSKKAPVKKAPVKKATAKKAAVRKAPVKKAPLKKAAVKKPAPKAKAPEKVVKKTVKAVEKPARIEKAPKPKKAEAKTVRKSSLVDTPPPVAPSRPKFVPPPAEPVHKQGAIGGTHTQAFIDKQRQRLLDLRDTLVDAMTGMTRDTIRNAPEGSEASGSGQHQGDAGSDAYDRDFALSVLAKEQDALYEIEQALLRIKKGGYGICEISERKIPTARLEAIPFARLTVECQAQWEKEYGTRRFKPSDEVGFSGGQPQEDEDSVTVSLDGDDD